jgi:hypothetical protein
MRKDSALVFGTSLLITIGIVGAAYYFHALQSVAPPSPHSAVEVSPSAESIGNPASPPTRTNQIIKCTDPKIGDFYTNAADCESADLENRLSYAQDFSPVGSLSKSTSKRTTKTPPITSNGSSNKPSLRSVARSVPDGLSVSCRFAVGRALEIERAISSKDQESESVWRENYCRWIEEAKTEKCDLEPGFFYYENLCPRV